MTKIPFFSPLNTVPITLLIESLFIWFGINYSQGYTLDLAVKLAHFPSTLYHLSGWLMGANPSLSSDFTPLSSYIYDRTGKPNFDNNSDFYPQLQNYIIIRVVSWYSARMDAKHWHKSVIWNQYLFTQEWDRKTNNV